MYDTRLFKYHLNLSEREWKENPEEKQAKPLTCIIIHSKYFPDSDWLKAQA